MKDSDYKVVKEYLVKHIKVKINGSLFAAVSDHHHTPFLIMAIRFRNSSQRKGSGE